MLQLKGKRAIVTAAGQGIGWAIARRFLELGCDVTAHYFSTEIDQAALLEGTGAAAEKLHVLSGDLTDYAAARQCTERAIEEMGGLEILVNNAGSLIARKRLEEVDAEFWRQSVELNMGSMLAVTQAARPALAKAGGASIVNLASLAGRKGGHPGSLVYATMKGAVLTWTRALATELGPEGIRVNAVAPGLILGTKFHDTHTSKESAAKTIEGIPLGRAGSADDVARVVVFLASEWNGFVTGATVDINGGVYAC